MKDLFAKNHSVFKTQTHNPEGRENMSTNLKPVVCLEMMKTNCNIGEPRVDPTVITSSIILKRLNMKTDRPWKY